MAWIALSSDDIENSLTEAEQNGLDTGSANSDLTTIVASVTALVRGKVNAWKPNQGCLGPAGTIPDELWAAAIAIGRFKLLTHLPGTQLITLDRRIDKDEAYAQLEAVASGELVIVRGTDLSGQSPVTPVGSGSSGSNLQGPDNPDSVTYTGWPTWPTPW